MKIKSRKVSATGCKVLLSTQAKKLPLSAGVYLFLAQKGRVLYVGRATSLRRRVLSYFGGGIPRRSVTADGAAERTCPTLSAEAGYGRRRPKRYPVPLGDGVVHFQKNLDPRIGEMIRLATKIKHQKTDSILEAIILEANLIKRYWPKYNIKERDNRSFIYIVIPKTDYPRPFLVRLKELQKFSGPRPTIFGPYQSLTLLKKALRLVRRIFPYSTCKVDSGRPCFDYQLGLCPGACVNKISKDDYQKNINNLILFLRGEKKKLLKKLEKENPFQRESLKHIQDVALVSKEETLVPFSFGANRITNKIEGYDISHLAGKETIGAMVTFLNGQPDKSYYRLFKIRAAPANDDLRCLEEVIVRRFKHLEWPLPDLILIDGGRPQVAHIFKVLKMKKINIPLVGISKFANDRLTFPPRLKMSSRDLLEVMKGTLLRVRNEAHRFALKNSRRQRKLAGK